MHKTESHDRIYAYRGGFPQMVAATTAVDQSAGANNDSSHTMIAGSHMVIAGGSFVQTNLVLAENRGKLQRKFCN